MKHFSSFFVELTSEMQTQTLLSELQELDAKYAFQNYGSRLPVSLVRGEGVRLFDEDGKQYLDFLGGIAVVTLGHNHPKVTAAIVKQANEILHVSNFFYIEPQVKLAAKLSQIAENAHGGNWRTFFCNSGAEANEAAIKIARRLAFDKGDFERVEIVTLKSSFHGRTLGALAATGQPKYQQGFGPLPLGFIHSEFNDIEDLRKNVSSKTAAVMFEPILGEAGILPLSDEFIVAAREICDENGALLIIDEVQSGCGRTGKFFSHEYQGVVPDIIPMAKGLANGVPIGAVIAKAEIAAHLTPGTHGTTFGGNFLAAAAGLATVEALYEENLMENAAEVGSYFAAQLEKWSEETGIVSEIRARGLMIGVSLNVPKAIELRNAAMKNGLIFNAVGDSITRFLPPLILTKNEVDAGMEILRASWEEIQ
ncbi:acetylornithine aminotransferase apoenzyme [Abditibacterium utsteinense]|uniref:Acetylornithine aminotransferase n=1 Tax=Abditibacterium utsteinense TaxID=1960156 RepID=A0A2S8STE7_9BACT|nr:acetylornithine transaminase [Abditibacterium utsteinense]PQV64019.1 acetylornithine aminotransferase apoenzyme [Abditibacterium utsteinense]